MWDTVGSMLEPSKTVTCASPIKNHTIRKEENRKLVCVIFLFLEAIMLAAGI